MLFTAIDLAALLIIILPGFLAYRFAVQRRADPASRSPLWQVSEILEHSAFVHIIGAALATIAISILNLMGITTHPRELFGKLPHEFLDKYFLEGILWFILYPVYIIVSSSIIGAYDTPGKVSSGIVKGVSNFTGRLSRKYKALSWIPVPQNPYPPEPIWYRAFNIMTDGYKAAEPILIVTLKSGDMYAGRLVSYPIVPDTESDKDFLITHAHYYKDGDLTRGQQMDSLDGVGAVLLNAANVDSIRIYYDDIQEG